MERYVEVLNYDIKYGVKFNNNDSMKSLDIFDTFEAAREYAYKCMETFKDVTHANIDVILWNRNSNRIDNSQYIFELRKEYI